MKDLKKYFFVPAPPQDVYIALTNPDLIEVWTGDRVEMSTEPDSEFSLWDGSISGRNIEFEPNKKIVQEWYFGDREAQSIVTIKLHPHKDGTSAEVRQTNIPDEDFNDISEGWETSYFGNIISFYED